MSEPQPKAPALSTYLVPPIALLVIVIAAYLRYQLGLNAQMKLTGKQKRPFNVDILPFGYAAF